LTVIVEEMQKSKKLSGKILGGVGSKDTRLDEEVRQTRKCDSPEPSRFGATAKLKMASALHAKVLEIHFRLSSLTALPGR